ncbi:MAG: hypothetical protein ACLQM8_04505 [Limisphaerales bacterium]
MLTVTTSNPETTTSLDPELSAETASYVAARTVALRRAIDITRPDVSFENRRDTSPSASADNTAPVTDPDAWVKAFSFLAQGSLRTSVVVERLSTLETWVRQSDELDPEGTKVLLISLGLGSTDPGRVRRATHYSNLFAGRIANVREQLKSSWPMSLPSTHQPKVAEAPAWLVRRMEALRQMPPPTLQEVDTQLKASAEARRKLIDRQGV